jgi:general secretion pathway protein C
MQTLLSRFNVATLTSPTMLRRSLWGLVLLLTALLGYTSSGTATWLLGRYLDSRFPAASTAPARVEASNVRLRKPITAFEPILGNNIFHARRSSGVPGGGPAPASAAPLKLTLSGLFVAGDTKFAFVVGPDGRTEQVYKPGDCIPRNSADDPDNKDCTPSQGRVSRILADRIVVSFGGQPTVFMLEENPDEGGGPGNPGVAAAVVAPGAPPAAGQLPSTRNGNTIETHIPSAEVEKAFENFAEIVKQARVVPYSKDGVTIGFQIQSIVPGSVFQRLGLQNFDIIKGVNGESLTSADQALRLFTVFRNEKEVVLDIQRQDAPLKLSYIIE